MKNEVPDYKFFVNSENMEQINRQKRLLIVVGTFLLLLSMSVMMVFTFYSFSEIKYLKQEIELLKASVRDFKNTDDHQSMTDQYADVYTDEAVDKAHVVLGPEVLDNAEYDSYYDYDVYEDIKTTAQDISNDVEQKFAGNLTKAVEDSKRTKRNIIAGYDRDEVAMNSAKYSTIIPPQSNNMPTPRPRKSRVMYDPSRAFRQTARLRSGDENSEENLDVDLTLSREEPRVRHGQRHVEVFDERPTRLGRMRPLPVIHFSGDTSKYVVGQHVNFNGNGHLRHPRRTFVDWEKSKWVDTLGMDRHFSIQDGVLTIKETGIYFVYAQIYYLDEHDTNGFRVYKNDETILQCTTMTHSLDRVMKGNTCYTAGAEYLQEGDRVSLGDLSDSRYSLFEQGKSFFGAIKLGDIRSK